MPKSTLAGHPLHPQIVPLPIGALVFTPIFDVIAKFRRDPRFEFASELMLKAGLLSGLAAGSAGALDYFTLPKGSRIRRIGTLHAIMNLSLLGAAAANLALRKSRPAHRSWWPFALSASSAAALYVSAWCGAHMVYEYGVRVKGRSEIENKSELAPPYNNSYDEKIAHAVESFEQKLPTRVGGSAANEEHPRS
jgi:uncharacterized membrane protein